MLETKKINDRIIKPYKGVDKRPYSYDDLFSHPYVNILIAGPKNTGKSVIVGNILRNSVSNRSVVRFFSTTMEADHTTDSTIKKLEKRGVDVEKYEKLDFGLLD